MMPPMLGQRGSCRTCSDRSQWSPPTWNFFTRFNFFWQPGQLTLSAISFTWTMSPNCEASSSTCLWRLVFFVPPRMNTTLLGAKLVLESRDCRDKLRGGRNFHIFTFILSYNLSRSNSQAKSSYDNQPKGKESLLVKPKHSKKKKKPTQLRPTLIQTRVSCLLPNLCAPPHDQPSCSLRCKVLRWILPFFFGVSFFLVRKITCEQLWLCPRDHPCICQG